jgi:hypothetical protein
MQREKNTKNLHHVLSDVLAASISIIGCNIPPWRETANTRTVALSKKMMNATMIIDHLSARPKLG